MANTKTTSSRIQICVHRTERLTVNKKRSLPLIQSDYPLGLRFTVRLIGTGTQRKEREIH